MYPTCTFGLMTADQRLWKSPQSRQPHALLSANRLRQATRNLCRLTGYGTALATGQDVPFLGTVHDTACGLAPALAAAARKRVKGRAAQTLPRLLDMALHEFLVADAEMGLLVEALAERPDLQARLAAYGHALGEPCPLGGWPVAMTARVLDAPDGA